MLGGGMALAVDGRTIAVDDAMVGWEVVVSVVEGKIFGIYRCDQFISNKITARDDILREPRITQEQTPQKGISPQLQRNRAKPLSEGAFLRRGEAERDFSVFQLVASKQEIERNENSALVHRSRIRENTLATCRNRLAFQFRVTKQRGMWEESTRQRQT